MRFTSVVQTHITEIARSAEIFQVLKEKFPDRDVCYLASGGYMINGSLSDTEIEDIESLVAKTIEKTNERNTKLQEAKRFVMDWLPADIPIPTNEVLSGLRQVHDTLIRYVLDDTNKKHFIMAQAHAKDCDDISVVYNYWHNKNYEAAAKYLRHLDTLVRDYVDSKTYNTIMEHYPR